MLYIYRERDVLCYLHVLLVLSNKQFKTQAFDFNLPEPNALDIGSHSYAINPNLQR